MRTHTHTHTYARMQSRASKRTNHGETRWGQTTLRHDARRDLFSFVRASGVGGGSLARSLARFSILDLHT